MMDVISFIVSILCNVFRAFLNYKVLTATLKSWKLYNISQLFF